jgi:phosphoenolpyruvate carboxylase
MTLVAPLTIDQALFADELRFVMGCLREVLLESGEPALAAAVPWLDDAPQPAAEVPAARLAQVLSITFQLLSIVEQRAAVQYRRALETREGLAAVPALWGEALRQLRDRGIDPATIAATLPAIHVEAVLTAHPTEAKRATVLEHHRALYLLLIKRADPRWTPYERESIRAEALALLTTLWRTGEIFLEKPDVASERRNGIHYLRAVFPDVLPLLDERLRQAWADAGLDPALLAGGRLPRLSFGSWVGGDRDGHPLVTAAVTRETLDELRLNALLLVQGQLHGLARALSLSDRLQDPPAPFVARIAAAAAELGAVGAAALERNPNEPWRQWVNLLLARLPLGPAPAPTAYRAAGELEADLRALAESLDAVGAWRLAAQEVRPLLRSLGAFGFHLAALDVRQNSAFHDRALGQLLAATGEAGGWQRFVDSAAIEHNVTTLLS